MGFCVIWAIRAPDLFALYVAGYSVGRIGEELLRVDPAHHVFGLRLSFFVAAALFTAGVAWFIHTPGAACARASRVLSRRGDPRRRRNALPVRLRHSTRPTAAAETHAAVVADEAAPHCE